MPRLTGPISVLALGILIVGFALDAEVWKSQSQFKVGLLTSEQALPPQPDKVDAEPRRRASPGKKKQVGAEPARQLRAAREAETAVTTTPKTEARARQVRSARNFRSRLRPDRPSGRERTRVGKAPVTASPPASPVALPPPAASPPPEAAGGPPAPAPPPVSPSPAAAPVPPAPRVPVGAATPPARGIPDPVRLPTGSTPAVPPDDEDGDESDGPDEESGFDVVDDARVDTEDGSLGADARDEEDDDEEEGDDD
jgi:hypothetical protein